VANTPIDTRGAGKARTALVLGSIVLVFFVGVIAKRIWFA
jgi:hypothetical protein